MSTSSPSMPSTDGLTLGGLAVQVSDLAQRVRRLESESGAPAAPAVAEKTMDQIRELTHRLFPGPIEATVEFDPENPSRHWILFEVTAKGEYRDYRDRMHRWHDEVAPIAADSALDCRLCVLPLR